jgi:hypothetical protein
MARTHEGLLTPPHILSLRRAALTRLSDPARILALCDKLRDEILPELGVVLDDQEGAP